MANAKWDKQSGIRERLALLALIGPTIEPADWRYHPRADRWFHYVGPHCTVNQEGSVSLDLIASNWRLDRRAAMALIGYPEPTRCSFCGIEADDPRASSACASIENKYGFHKFINR